MSHALQTVAAPKLPPCGKTFYKRVLPSPPAIAFSSPEGAHPSCTLTVHAAVKANEPTALNASSHTFLAAVHGSSCSDP